MWEFLEEVFKQEIIKAYPVIYISFNANERTAIL